MKKGTHHSDVSKQKLSTIQKGVYESEKTRKNISDAQRKKSCRTIKPNTDLFWSWLAGVIDGEGSFLIEIHRHPKMRLGFQCRAWVTIASSFKNSDFMHKLKEQVGLGTISDREFKHDYKANKTRGLTEWRVRNFYEVIQLCNAVRPYIVLKKEICTNFLEIYELIKGHQDLNVEGFLKIATLRDKLNAHRERSPLYKNSDWFRKRLESL